MVILIALYIFLSPQSRLLRSRRIVGEGTYLATIISPLQGEDMFHFFFAFSASTWRSLREPVFLFLFFPS